MKRAARKNKKQKNILICRCSSTGGAPPDQERRRELVRPQPSAQQLLSVAGVGFSYWSNGRLLEQQRVLRRKGSGLKSPLACRKQSFGCKAVRWHRKPATRKIRLAAMAAVQKTDIGAVMLHRGFESSIFRQLPGRARMMWAFAIPHRE